MKTIKLPFIMCILMTVEHVSTSWHRCFELTTATYDAFLVTAHQKDIAKPNAANPKYRAVLNVVKSEKLYVPGQSLEQPEVAHLRMPHLIFGEILEMKPATEN